MKKYDRSQMLDLYHQGLELAEIAERVGCSTGIVSLAVNENGESPFLRRYPNVKNLDVPQLLQDYKNGMKLKDIHDKYKITYFVLKDRLKESGTPMRQRPSVMGKLNGQYKHGLGSRRKERNENLTKQVAALCLGHVVPRNWHIHHIDENPANNNYQNLAIFPTKSAHAIYHQRRLRLQREGQTVDASQTVLESGGWPLPSPPLPLTLPHETDRLFPQPKTA